MLQGQVDGRVYAQPSPGRHLHLENQAQAYGRLLQESSQPARFQQIQVLGLHGGCRQRHPGDGLLRARLPDRHRCRQRQAEGYRRGEVLQVPLNTDIGMCNRVTLARGVL